MSQRIIIEAIERWDWRDTDSAERARTIEHIKPMRRIFAEARELGLPEPKIEEAAMRLRFTVYLDKPLQIHAIATAKI